jgi:hypothetical protein
MDVATLVVRAVSEFQAAAFAEPPDPSLTVADIARARRFCDALAELRG